MTEYFIDLWSNHSERILSLGYKILLAFAVLVASSIVARMVKGTINRAAAKSKRFDPTLVPVFRNLARYTVYAIGLVIILDILGVNTTSLIAVLGAAGLAIGLALKDTLGNIAAGIMLLILRPMRVGEAIQCGAVTGVVKEIGLFSSVINTPDGLMITAPNSVLWGAPMTNFSRNGTRRMDMVVGIAYGDSIDDGFKVLQGIIDNDSRILTDPAPQIMVESLGDSSVNLQLRAWATVDDYWSVWWDLNRTVKEKIEAAGLSIPFPQQDVYMHEVK